MTVAKPKCRWLPRFGLRTLMIGVGAFGAVLGSFMIWYRAQAAEYRRQIEIGERVKSYHGGVHFSSRKPVWWLGDAQVFQRIDSVSFKLEECDAVAIAKELAQIDSVDFIEFDEHDLDNMAFLEQLAKLRFLKEVYVGVSYGPGMATSEQHEEIGRKVLARLAQVRKCLPNARAIPQGSSD
jgi:hypothetical protein